MANFWSGVISSGRRAAAPCPSASATRTSTSLKPGAMVLRTAATCHLREVSKPICARRKASTFPVGRSAVKFLGSTGGNLNSAGFCGTGFCLGGAAWFPFISEGGFCAAGNAAGDAAGDAAWAMQTPVKKRGEQNGASKTWDHSFLRVVVGQTKEQVLRFVQNDNLLNATIPSAAKDLFFADKFNLIHFSCMFQT